MATCDRCGQHLEIGQFPFCDGTGAGHGRPVPHRPFRAYFDLSLGEQVTSNYQRNQVARRLNAEMRDPVSPGDISARRDRVEEAKCRKI